MKYYLIFIINLIIQLKAKQLSQNDVILAIDCGSSSSYKSSEGILYAQDSNYSRNSKNADYSNNQVISRKQIKYTDDPQLYKTERHADESFAYSIPLKDSGVYTLILKFCELYFTEPGKRVFNIAFGNVVVAQDVDIVKEVGFMAAYDLYIEFYYDKQQQSIIYNDKRCDDALDGDYSGLIIEFQKGAKDLPKVDAIVMVKLPRKETNENEYQNLIKNWQEDTTLSIEEIQFKKMTELRNKIKEDFDSHIDNSQNNQTRIEGIIEIMLSLKGILILSTLMIFFALMQLTKDETDLLVKANTKQNSAQLEEKKNK